MGATAVAIVYSPWGKQSGAHMNPSVTLTFLALGKVQPWDALFYTLAQFTGALAGVAAARLVLGAALAHPAVGYVATLPHRGASVAFAAELAIAFLLMSTILVVSNSPWARWTGVFAGSLVALYITFEDPLSGMSLNPARTLASAVAAMRFDALWVYFTAPALGLLAASQAYTRLRGRAAVSCAKLHHQNPKRCIFCREPVAARAA
jgi:aquaporin Z